MIVWRGLYRRKLKTLVSQTEHVCNDLSTLSGSDSLLFPINVNSEFRIEHGVVCSADNTIPPWINDT